MSVFPYVDYYGSTQRINVSEGVFRRHNKYVDISSMLQAVILQNGRKLPDRIRLNSGGRIEVYDGNISYSLHPDFVMIINTMTYDRPFKEILNFTNKTMSYVFDDKFKERHLITHLEEWVNSSYEDCFEKFKHLVSHRTFLGDDFDLTSIVDSGYHNFVENWKCQNDLLVEQIKR